MTAFCYEIGGKENVRKYNEIDEFISSKYYVFFNNIKS